MKLDIHSLMSLIYPPSEDEALIKKCSNEDFVQKFNLSQRHSLWSLASFSDSSIRAAIHLNKFHDHTKAQKLLGSLLAAWLSELPHHEYVLIPIPLSDVRERKRGHNQVTSFVRLAIAELPSFSLEEHTLVRTRNTVPQTTLSSLARKSNLVDAFSVTNTTRISGKHLILIDDVYTTGSTLTHARTVLEKCGPASLLCVALAH